MPFNMVYLDGPIAKDDYIAAYEDGADIVAFSGRVHGRGHTCLLWDGVGSSELRAVLDQYCALLHENRGLIGQQDKKKPARRAVAEAGPKQERAMVQDDNNLLG